jgi:NifU-like protein involved in Fe-S cluster formation
MNVEEMYQQIILDHYREKHHSGLRDKYDDARREDCIPNLSCNGLAQW